MFESRVRAQHQEVNHNGNSHQFSKSASTEAVYRSQANRHVLQRTKEDGAQLAAKRHAAQIRELSNKRQKLSDDLTTKSWNLTADFIGDILAEKDILREKKEVEIKLETLKSQDPVQLWFARVQPLKPEEVGSLAVLSHITENEEQIFNTDPDRCKCGRIFKFECIVHMDVCLVCKTCKKVLLAAEDIQTDLNCKMAQKKQEQNHRLAIAKNHEKAHSAQIADGTIAMNAADTVAQKKKAAKQLVMNVSNYKKYLLPFSVEAIEIPEQCWSLLYESLASIHLLNSLRCKPVPVEKIFKENHKSAFVAHANRITKMFTGEPVPILSLELIENLTKRYSDLFEATCEIFGNAKNLPGKEILTHVFLLMENREDLASAFSTHKTNNVSPIYTPRFWQMVQHCQKKSPLMSWKYQ